MDAHIIERIIALIGAIVVALFALKALREEWPKKNLDDHVTKIMMGLLTIGCLIVIIVAIGFAGRA